MKVILLVLSHGMQSGLDVCPLQWVEMHSIAAIGLAFFWTSYFMSLPVLYMISVFRKLTVHESVHIAYSLLKKLVFIFSLSFFHFSFYCVPCVRFHNKYNVV